MSHALFACSGGTVTLPARDLILVSRTDGGHLVVHPPRHVWERSELTRDELAAWATLVAAAGRAMLDVLPQLQGGCINYWEAGNWALHDEAPPRGPKFTRQHRRVHLHLLGRSRTATSPSWKWGEAPQFPAFVDRHAWASACEPLIVDECQAIVARLKVLLSQVYGLQD